MILAETRSESYTSMPNKKLKFRKYGIKTTTSNYDLLTYLI